MSRENRHEWKAIHTLDDRDRHWVCTKCGGETFSSESGSFKEPDPGKRLTGGRTCAQYAIFKVMSS